MPSVWISQSAVSQAHAVPQELSDFTQSFRPCRLFHLPSNGINIPEPILLVNLLGGIE